MMGLLREGPRAEGRTLLRQHLQARLVAYRSIADARRTAETLSAVVILQGRISNLGVREAREDKSQPLAQVLSPALNVMFDIGSTRVLATLHPQDQTRESA